MDTQPRTSPLAHRDFRLLFGGGSIFALGDQFNLVSLPAMFAAAGRVLSVIELACMGSPALRSMGTLLRVPDAA